MKSFAWSFSALTRYENCPKQYWEINHQKNFKDEDSSFSTDGKAVHDALYKRVLKGTPLPLPMRNLEDMASRFAEADGEKHGEMKLALNRQMQPVDYFAKDVWVRVVIDLLIVSGTTAVVIDWKTGKVKEDYTQMGLCAAVLARWMPEIDLFKTVLVWTAHKKLSPKNYTTSKLQEVWNDLLPRVNKIEESIATTTFPAKASGLCGYCPVRTCAHWKDRD